MEELSSIISLLKKIREKNNIEFNLCPEGKLLNDTEYGKLFQAYWTSDFKLKNLIALLEVIEKNSIPVSKKLNT
jgi:hypothetical protein